MTLRHMKILVEVYRQNSVTKAALTAGMPEGARPAVFTMVAGGAAAQAKYEFAYDLEFSAEDDGGDDGDFSAFSKFFFISFYM